MPRSLCAALGKEAVAALIGSSNVTNRAYRESHHSFNYEGDVLIWRSNPDFNAYFLGEVVEQAEDNGVEIFGDSLSTDRAVPGGYGWRV
jgi:hypothetical protein